MIELPPYHLPALSILIRLTWQRLKSFLLRAGAIIVPVSTIIYFLNAITLEGHINLQAWHSESILAQLGKTLTPLFQPMGIHPENWPATVGLLSGILAKEVVLGTLNTLYSQASPLIHGIPQSLTSFDFWDSVRQAFASIPQNMAAIQPTLNLFDPSAAASPHSALMQQHFEGKIGAFAYLLFTLLYIPCMSTFA